MEYKLIVKKPRYKPIVKKVKPYALIVKKEKTLREKLATPVTREEIAKAYDVNPRIFDIMEAWQERGFVVSRAGTKAYQETIKLIKGLLGGTIFNDCPNLASYHKTRWSTEKIIKVFDKFKVMCFSVAYEPRNKENLKKAKNLSYFLLTGYQEKFSWFVRIHEKELKLVAPDKHPEMTKVLMRRYTQEILGGKGGDDIDPELFIKATQRIVDYVRKYKIHQVANLPITERSMANWLFESVLSTAQKMSVTPSYFCSNYTFEVRLPAYLVQQGIVGGEFFKPTKF